MLINMLLVEQTIECEGLWERVTAANQRGLTLLVCGHINPHGSLTLDLSQASFLKAA